MIFFRKFIFLLIVCYCISSCRDTFGEQHNSSPKKSNAPIVAPSSSEKPLDEKKVQDQMQTPIQQEVKKKKTKPIDTLKPVKAVP